MIFLPVSNTTHLSISAKCYKGTKGMLIAWLSMQPIKSGCYIYFDKSGVVLYVGKSNTLASRLTHHSTPQGVEKLIPEWFCIGIVFSNNPHLTEKELTRTLQPKLNKLNK
jgi:excinuclease UvrABC nuclease subunit